MDAILTPLESALRLERLDDARFSVDVPDGWQQGRGAFGGLTVGLMARAAIATEPRPGRPMRALTAELLGPVLPGEATVRVEVLRAGSGLSAIAARIEQSGGVQAHAVVMLGKRRGAGGDWVELDAPAVPSWDGVPVFEVDRPFAPVFSRHFEFRPTGGLPFSGGAAKTSGWVRPRAAPSHFDDALIAVLADAWWPAAFTRLDAPQPIATIGYSLEIVGDAARLAPELPLHHAAHAVAARDGYVAELRELRDVEGRLVALNQQTIALI
jgi:hypothetical protein